jgi:hypothetical protein
MRRFVVELWRQNETMHERCTIVLFFATTVMAKNKDKKHSSNGVIRAPLREQL